MGIADDAMLRDALVSSRRGGREPRRASRVSSDARRAEDGARGGALPGMPVQQPPHRVQQPLPLRPAEPRPARALAASVIALDDRSAYLRARTVERREISVALAEGGRIGVVRAWQPDAPKTAPALIPSVDRSHLGTPAGVLFHELFGLCQ